MSPSVRNFFFLGFVIVSTLPISSRAKNKKGSWRILKVEDQSVIFCNGKRLNTDLFNLHFIGALNEDTDNPLMIFSASDCKDCCDYESIYLFYPALSEKPENPELAPYDFPGCEFSDDDSILLYKSRMFIGQVLPDVPKGIIWYQTMLGDDGVYQSSVYLITLKTKIDAGSSQLYTEKLLLKDAPPISETLNLCLRKKCIEVPGKDYLISEE